MFENYGQTPAAMAARTERLAPVAPPGPGVIPPALRARGQTQALGAMSGTALPGFQATPGGPSERGVGPVMLGLTRWDESFLPKGNTPGLLGYQL